MKYQVTITAIQTYVVDVETFVGDVEKLALYKVRTLMNAGKRKSASVALVESDVVVTNVIEEKE